MKKIILLIIITLSYSFFGISENNGNEIYLTYAINDEIPVKDNVAFIKNGDSIKLYPVIVKKGRYYCNAREINVDNISIKTNRMSSLHDLHFYGIKPVLNEYDNISEADKNHLLTYKEDIEYDYFVIDDYRDYINDIIKNKTYGTYYIMIDVNELDINHSLKTSEALHIEKDNLLQIVYRSDDTYIGYLKELFNTPFILAPKSVEGRYHQTDERVGSDCAELAIYGLRRLGYDIPYCGPKYLYKYLKPKINSKIYLSNKGEYYVDKNNNKIKITEEEGIWEGDIVHFGIQVSVFYQDKGIKGYLDKKDLLIQSYGITPHITTIEDSGFMNYNFDILNFRDLH